MQEKRSILLIGYDSNLCLGVMYCLKQLNYSFYVLSWNKRIAAKYSVFVKKTFYYSSYDHLENQVIDIIQTYKIDVIMPFDELEIEWVKKKNALLSKYAACIWGTEPEYFELGINKKRLAAFLTEHHLPCPQYAAVNTLEQLEIEASKIGYPLLVKPTRSNFGRGIKRFENWEDLKTFYQTDKEADKEYIIQPFIVGSDITCNVICKEGELLCHTIQESPVKYGSNFGSNDILEFHDDPYVIETVGKMMKLLHWHGVACVDIRRNAKNGEIFILEINGRFWASVVSSFLKAGVNFPEIMVKLALGEPVSFAKQRPAFQISLKQYATNVLTFKKASLNSTKYISYFIDPLARLMQMLGH